MYLVREVFRTKPGKAKDLVAIFKKTAPYMMEFGANNFKVMTDLVADYWTVVVESEIDSFDIYMNPSGNTAAQEKIGEIMKGYMELVQEGHREIFKLE